MARKGRYSHSFQHSNPIAPLVFLLFLLKGYGSLLDGQDIIVGIVSTGEFTEATAAEQWSATFADFLTQSVGRTLFPPRNFSITMMTVPMTFTMVEEKSIDFIFSTPSIYYCLSVENAGTHMFLQFN